MKLDADGAITLNSIGGQTFSDSLGTFRLIDSDNTADFFQIEIGSDGDTKLTTHDHGATIAHFEIEADGNITLDAAGDIVLEAGGNDLTLDADTFSFTSATSQKPEILITDSTNGTDGSRIKLIKNRNGNGSAGVDNDLISAIQFSSYNDAGTPEYVVYSQIVSNIQDKTDGQETGNMRLQVAAHGGGLETGLTLTGGSQDDEVDATIGLGTASVTTIAGDLTVSGSDLTFDSVALTAIQTSGETFADNDTSIMTSAAIDDRINTGDAAIASDLAAAAIQTSGESFADNDTSLMTSAAIQDKIQAHYSYQYMNFSFKVTTYAEHTWVSPHANGIEYYLWGNQNVYATSGTTQVASHSPVNVTAGSTLSIDYLDQGTSGLTVPVASEFVGFRGNIKLNNTTPNTSRPIMGFFRAAEPSDRNNSDVTATVISFDKYDTSSGSNNRNRFLGLSETLGSPVSLAAGDIIFPAVGLDVDMSDTAGQIWGNFTIVLRTLIP